MKLRAQFSLFTSLIVFLVVFALGLLLLKYSENLIAQEIKNGQQTLLRNFTQICEESVITDDDLLFLNFVEMIKRTNEGLIYALFIDNNGHILTKAEDKLVRQIPQEIKIYNGEKLFRKTFFTKDRENVLNIALPVFAKGKKLGQAHLGFSQDYFDRKLRQDQKRMRKNILVIALLILGLGILITFWLIRRITRPVKSLAEGAKLIGEGRLGHRIPVRGANEIGDLSKEFNQMAEKLEKLDEMKDDFIASVSHELRSPLAAISGYTEVLADGVKKGLPLEKQAKALKIIGENTERLRKFIDDILDLAKIEAGKADIKIESFDLFPLISEAVALMNPLTAKKQIEVSQEFHPDVPPVLADREKLRQVLINLLSNAIKFTPDGGKIAIKTIRGDEEFIKVSIRDTGIGIPHSELENIFNKFEQVKGTRDKVKGAKGTGLGLSIVKGVVEAHGGRIWAESEPGQGSTFHFTLPYQSV